MNSLRKNKTWSERERERAIFRELDTRRIYAFARAKASYSGSVVRALSWKWNFPDWTDRKLAVEVPPTLPFPMAQANEPLGKSTLEWYDIIKFCDFVLIYSFFKIFKFSEIKLSAWKKLLIMIGFWYSKSIIFQDHFYQILISA